MSFLGILFFIVLAGLALGALGLACLCALDYWADRERRKEQGQ